MVIKFNYSVQVAYQETEYVFLLIDIYDRASFYNFDTLSEKRKSRW